MKKLCCILALVGALQAAEMDEIFTDQAPKAIGPYSQAIRAGDYLFVSGQIPIDPATGAFAGKEIEEQTEQVLRNLVAILTAAGLKLEDVVKTEVYLKDLSHFQKMNAVYAKWFSHEIKPARQALQVAHLPQDALIEISCIAWAPRY